MDKKGGGGFGFWRWTGLVLVLVVAPSFATDLVFQVYAGKEECFFQSLSSNDTLYIDYTVVSSSQGALDINFQLSDMTGRPILSEFRKAESTHKVPVPRGGVYKACFDNTFSHFSHKTVAFQITSGIESEEQWKDYDLQKDDGLDMQVNDIEKIVRHVRLNLDKIENYQLQFRLIELKDRSIGEFNFERVNFWSMVNLLVVVSVGALQVFVVKSLFKDPKQR